jgi:hypothetical protein
LERQLIKIQNNFYHRMNSLANAYLPRTFALKSDGPTVVSIEDQLINTSDTDEETYYSSGDESSDDNSSSSDSSYGSDTKISVQDYMGELELWMNALAVRKTPKPKMSMPSDKLGKTPKRMMSMPADMMGNADRLQTAGTHPMVLNRMQRCQSAYIQIRDDTSPQAKVDPSTEKPEDCLAAIFLAEDLDLYDFAPNADSFLKVTEEHIAGHTLQVTSAARKDNLTLLKKFLHEGKSLQCCNRYGESLVHIVCRRGSPDVLRFLIEEAKVSITIRDDVGRNPMHDAAWTDKPNFDLVKVLMSEAPKLMFAKDTRGHSPLNYIPKQRWEAWCDFFKSNQEILLAVASE